MSADEEVILDSNQVFEIEVRGFDHIPEPERNMALRHVDHLWVANSVNLFSFALGAIAITLGLNLLDLRLSRGVRRVRRLGLHARFGLILVHIGFASAGNCGAGSWARLGRRS